MAKKLNQKHMRRAEFLLAQAERLLEDKARQSAGYLWRGDVRAFRYVLEALKKEQAK